MRPTLIYVKATHLDMYVQSRAKSSAAFGSRAGRCTTSQKKSFFIFANFNTNYFFTNSKLRVHNTCVKFYFRCMWGTHKKFQLFIKLLLKIIFFAKFDSLKTTDIFIPSIKFSRNYQQNFIHVFLLQKWRLNIYLNKKTIKKISKIIQIFF